MRILKDILLQRCKAINAVALVIFVCSVLEKKDYTSRVDCNKNICESINAIFAKFIVGKRTMLSGRFSFNNTIGVGGLCANTSGHFRQHMHKELQNGLSIRWVGTILLDKTICTRWVDYQRAQHQRYC